MRTEEEYLAKADEWIDAAERLDVDRVGDAAHYADVSRAYTALAQFALASRVATEEAGARRTTRAMLENP